MRVIVQKVQARSESQDYSEFEAMRESLIASVDEETQQAAANEAAEGAGVEYDAYVDFIRYVTKIQAVQANAV
ncbi:MAG TPA: hypothetical protein VF883_10760 [Thermoanaerobaculia bacterium]|jgi:hypothetical protein